MPRGPNGEKRPADVIGAAVKVEAELQGRRFTQSKAPGIAAAMNDIGPGCLGAPQIEIPKLSQPLTTSVARPLAGCASGEVCDGSSLA
jgi:hypothetical protein